MQCWYLTLVDKREILYCYAIFFIPAALCDDGPDLSLRNIFWQECGETALHLAVKREMGTSLHLVDFLIQNMPTNALDKRAANMWALFTTVSVSYSIGPTNQPFITHFSEIAVEVIRRCIYALFMTNPNVWNYCFAAEPTLIWKTVVIRRRWISPKKRDTRHAKI